MTTPDPVLLEKEGPIAWLTFNRPEALNAVNLAMRDLFWEYLQAVRDDPEVRVVVLRGAGGRAFCAGADVKEFGTSPSYLAAREARRQRDLWGTMLESRKPFVAAINGYALGAGCEMSLYCDVRIAANDARLGLPEVTLGYIPSAGGSQTLPRRIPPGVAAELLMTGEPIGAERAFELGLVHSVVSLTELYPAARRVALQLAAVPQPALEAVRDALAAARDLPLEQALTVSSRIAAVLLARPDAMAAISALAGPPRDRT